MEKLESQYKVEKDYYSYSPDVRITVLQIYDRLTVKRSLIIRNLGNYAIQLHDNTLIHLVNTLSGRMKILKLIPIKGIKINDN